MTPVPPYQPPVPLFVPALTAVLALLILFVFGVREQRQLAAESTEQIISQRENIAQIVAAAMQADLQAAEASARAKAVPPRG